MAIRGTEPSSLWGTIKLLDESSVKIITSAEELMHAMHHGDTLGAVQSTVEGAKGVTEVPEYASLAIHNVSTAIAIASSYIPISIDESFSHFLDETPVVHAVVAMGIVVSSLEIVANTIDLYKQSEVLSVIEDGQDLVTTLDDLEKMNFNFFKTSLPIHLKNKVEKYGDENVFSYLKDEVRDGRDSTAKKVVAEMHDYTLKKRIVHTIAIVAAICGLAASIGLLVAFPPAAIFVLTALGMAFTAARYVLNKGWVENPQDGFNWKLILPEFMRKGKLATTTDSEPLEMKQMGRYIDSKNLIQTQVHFVTSHEDETSTWDDVKTSAL